MAKVRLTALDYIIVASHYVATGKRKEALKMLEQAAAEEDFEDTLTTLDSANEEGFDDGEDDLSDDDLDLDTDAEEELSVAVANLQRARRRRPALAADADEVSDSDSDADEGDYEEEAEDEEEADDVEEVSTLRSGRRARNLKSLARLSR